MKPRQETYGHHTKHWTLPHNSLSVKPALNHSSSLEFTSHKSGFQKPVPKDVCQHFLYPARPFTWQRAETEAHRNCAPIPTYPSLFPAASYGKIEELIIN